MEQMEPQKLKDVLHNKRPVLMTLDKSSLIQERITRYRLLELTNIIIDSFQKFIDELDKNFIGELCSKIRNYLAEIYSLGLAFYAADVYHETLDSEDSKLERKKLAAKVQEHDRTLFKWAWALFETDEKLSKILSAIKKGSGYRDSADDVVKSVKFLENNWARVENKTPLTPEYLDLAAKDALKLIKLLDKIEKVKTHEMKDLRKRAYTAWYEQYMEIRAAGHFILRGRKDLDLNKLFPNVSPIKSKYSTKKPKDSTNR